ncbi:MAG TPA: hypothetical protein VKB25_15590 [Conexibacter sp.]|nr:hypothetical protein [Conexibacter sp.]
MKLTIFVSRRRVPALALVSAVALLALGAVGSSAATTVSTSGLAGWSASAHLGNWDADDPCYGHSSTVEAFDQRERGDAAGPSKDFWLRLILTQNDRCSEPGGDPPFPTDVSVYGDAVLAPGDLTVRGDLGTATLKATVAFRPYGWTSTLPVDIDLTWHAVEDAVGPKYRFMFGFPDGRRVFYRYMGDTRRAVVSGTVTSDFLWGRPIEYGGEGYGDLFSGHTGYVVIQK